MEDTATGVCNKRIRGKCCKTQATVRQQLRFHCQHRFIARAIPIHCRGTSLLLVPSSEISRTIQQLTKTAGFSQLTTGSEAVLEPMKLDVLAGWRKSDLKTVTWVPAGE